MANQVASVLKVFSVLETLVEEKRAGLADLSLRAMTTKSTAHRLLQTMIDLGYSAYSLAMQSTLGYRNPLHSTSLGKALLAWRDEREIHDRLGKMDFAKLAPHTITDREQYLEQLKTARDLGYAEEIEESEAGVRCMAAPIRDHLGKSVAAMSISFPLFRFDETKKAEYVALLKTASLNASRALGYLETDAS
ncbi:IclR family transcriptional regulator domain-containing protein [Cohaesibacter haloalkalitolerans]|uniref:IclR family transcriptional regulator domain-containing protein n=1 Tax=Cohaesibacter haloalkalitolerans TaxID=1162980 RepID=UPI000E65E00F|nr:IclR family transcriptional regulator C-terminal domain-containing protein [Cohaesibacter haloalkalitolerans]